MFARHTKSHPLEADRVASLSGLSLYTNDNLSDPCPTRESGAATLSCRWFLTDAGRPECRWRAGVAAHPLDLSGIIAFGSRMSQGDAAGEVSKHKIRFLLGAVPRQAANIR